MDKKKKTDNIHFIPFYKVEVPKFKETKFNDWIKYGDNNNYPAFLEELSNRSALHNAIITSKVENTVGDGFVVEEENEFNDFLNDTDFYTNIVTDYVLYGGYAVKVSWSKESVMRGKVKQIATLEHIDFKKIRCGSKNLEGKIENYFYSNDWTAYRKKENTPVSFPAFNEEKRNPEQIFYFSAYRPGSEYYPLPSYVGALASIQTDGEISNFHLANILNGMSPGYIVTFVNGIPTGEEMSETEAKLIKKFSKTDNAGRDIINFVDDPTHAPKVERLAPANLDKQFIQLEQSVQQNILTGHKITSPMLVGIKTEGQLGGASEIENAYKIYAETVIKPIQKSTTQIIKIVENVNDIDAGEIITNTPISFTFSESILSQILTEDEMREMIGMEPKEITEINKTI